MTKNSDIPLRTASAVVMLAVAGAALWLGGWAWIAFCGAVAAGVLWEWRALVRRFVGGALGEAGWMTGGMVYIGIAAAVLMVIRQTDMAAVLMVAGGVIATDIGAYFAGRTFGGPRIAPKVSPSKTWSGLVGGMIAAALVLLVITWFDIRHSFSLEGGCATARTCPTFADQAIPVALSGFLLAIVAQTGDFFESWMKRRAGVKDSGSLIPGHGGLFDRADGLLAVLFVIGVFSLAGSIR